MSTVKNYNSAKRTNFKLEIPGDDVLSYFLQTVVLPGISMAHNEVNYQNHMAMNHGNQVTYTPFNATFILQEDFENYLFIRDWMLEFRDTDEAWLSIAKDIKLHVLTANKTANIIFTFTDAFPTSLSDLDFSNATNESEDLTFDVEFAYQTICSKLL